MLHTNGFCPTRYGSLWFVSEGRGADPFLPDMYVSTIYGRSLKVRRINSTTNLYQVSFKGETEDRHTLLHKNGKATATPRNNHNLVLNDRMRTD
mmetsp:Transcript_37278/g.57234  ORF Transcript_37278/g.57234 Transcript_37278/m.57234 type:complete len:94 (-) Transcript_37278:24-305(-)